MDLVLLAFLASTGCAGASTPGTAAPPRRDAAAPARAVVQTEGDEDQRQAQRAWCVYLQALYLRAADDETSWPKFDQCTRVTTMASPRMLRQAAECSLHALQRFEGDPFTAEYAAEVTRCGNAALDASAVPLAELAPFVEAICSRIVDCGGEEYGACRERIESGLALHLERAVGAMNQRGREKLEACLQKVGCDDMGRQITGCLEPIMDDLLWLPG